MKPLLENQWLLPGSSLQAAYFPPLVLQNGSAGGGRQKDKGVVPCQRFPCLNAAFRLCEILLLRRFPTRSGVGVFANSQGSNNSSASKRILEFFL